MSNKIFRYLLKTQPYSRLFGFDRGLPVDRYYIEKFLESKKYLISGDILEIAESYYTKKFAHGAYRSLILHSTEGTGVDFVGNLATGDGIVNDVANCFIMTQTLQCIFDFRAALKNSLKLIRSGGNLLITVPGITQISRYDYDRWGFYWTFNDMSLRKLFEEVVPSSNIEIQAFGNVKSAAAFLYGLASNELSQKDLDQVDPDYQVTITATIIKP